MMRDQVPERPPFIILLAVNLVNPPKPQQLGQLPRVNLVVLNRILPDPRQTARMRNDNLLYHRPQN
jgi:hypothetical protein